MGSFNKRKCLTAGFFVRVIMICFSFLDRCVNKPDVNDGNSTCLYCCYCYLSLFLRKIPIFQIDQELIFLWQSSSAAGKILVRHTSNKTIFQLKQLLKTLDFFSEYKRSNNLYSAIT